MSLAEAVRLAASVLDDERKRELTVGGRGAAQAGNNYRGIGMEIATVAVLGEEKRTASVYVYDDADVESVLASLDRESTTPGVDERDDVGD